MNTYPFVRYHPERYTETEMLERSRRMLFQVQSRRSVRHFSDKILEKEVVENIILSAGTAPSGAHKQPWTFCVITNQALKSEIRKAAEEEERRNYSGRMSDEWIRDLAPLGTDDEKAFLEVAPVLIVVFKRSYEIESGGHKHPNYYVSESVGLACGILIQAIHHAGLVCLTHTPSPMNFLEKILERPANEKAFLLIPVGHAADEVMVPDLQRKKLDEICQFFD